MNDSVSHASTDLAMQLLREGRLHECISCAEKVLEANPDDARAYGVLGAAYSQFGDHGMAIAAFERALAVEESPRHHFNLGRAYEDCGRTGDALEQYRLAEEMDQSYRPAGEALARLSKVAGNGPPPTTAAAAAPEPHLLLGEDSPGTDTPLAASDTGDPAPPTEQTVVTQASRPTDAPIPDPRMPDLRALEWRASVNAEKVRQVQRQMTKAGLIYGVIVGPVCLMAVLFLSRFFLFLPMNLLILGAAGVVLGALVGLWVGFTSGDETDGAKAGAVLGLLTLGGFALVNLPKLSAVFAIVYALGGTGVGALAGYLIGWMVTNSIGE